MINVIKELKGNILLVKLAGSIEESVNFDQLIGPPPAELHVNCKEVPRINSVGVKAWIRYFQAAQTKGTKLRFQECSTAIVEQINLISNFTCGGVVESIYVPFSCTNCKGELVGLFKTDDLKKMQFNLPELKCSKCSSKAIFDDIPEEFFGFLQR
jgi:DNA-directed RNA polymerase subunit RPC12/RpoP/anti-anti-sigma regulatory factor